MSRQVRRVPLDFPWTQEDGHWPGYLLGSICEAVESDCDKCRRFAAILGIPLGDKRDCPIHTTDIEPPTGEGWQVWETVSEGSPISPVFATPEELARHMTLTRWGADRGTSYEAWLAFITGPGWAPSMVCSAEHGVQTGVQATLNADAPSIGE